MKRICLISNCAPVYRKGIFDLLDRQYNVHWAFGHVQNIVDLDTSHFNGTVTTLKLIKLPLQFYWLQGCINLCTKKNIDYYIIIGDINCLSVWLCALILKLKHKKVFFWSHGSLREIKGLRKLCLKLFWSNADCGLIYNTRSRKLMEHAVSTCKNYITVYNSLDYDKQLIIRNNLTKSDIYARHFNKDNPTIAFIGRLIPSKKLDIILRLALMLKSDEFPINIVFIGDGEEKDRLENMAQEFGLSSNVWFYGCCFDENINAELLYNADLCLSPGEVGLTAIHSLMFGLPVATHNNLNRQGPEFEAIIDGETGFFFNENDLSDLYNKTVSWFLNNSSKREQIRQECYNVIDSVWNPKHQLSIIERAIDSI